MIDRFSDFILKLSLSMQVHTLLESAGQVSERAVKGQMQSRLETGAGCIFFPSSEAEWHGLQLPCELSPTRYGQWGENMKRSTRHFVTSQIGKQPSDPAAPRPASKAEAVRAGSK